MRWSDLSLQPAEMASVKNITWVPKDCLRAAAKAIPCPKRSEIWERPEPGRQHKYWGWARRLLESRRPCSTPGST